MRQLVTSNVEIAHLTKFPVYLWLGSEEVLTDSQLKAMVQYAKSLSEAIEKSTEQRKSMAPEPTQSSTVTSSAQHVKTPQAANAPDLSDAIVKLFNDFDVKETSHHLVISHLDLHICDDIHAKEKGNLTPDYFGFCTDQV